MKNILAENLLRFGVKNLKETNMIRLKSLLKEQVAAPLTAEQEAFLKKCCERTNCTWKVDIYGYVIVNGSFDCSQMQLSNFLGIRFGTVKGYFDCSQNNLTSLEGAPTTVLGEFNCTSNRLTNLKGAPKTVGWGFLCENNNNLTSLEGVPYEIGTKIMNGDFRYPAKLGTAAQVRLQLKKQGIRISGAVVSVGPSPDKNNPQPARVKY